MIEVKKLIKILDNTKINFFSGVPDSVLKETKHFFENKKTKNHLVVSNEGLGVATCIGYYLSKKKNSLSIYAKFWFGKCDKSSCVNCT